MGIQLQRDYMGYKAGTVAWFDKPTEEALVAQGFGTASSAASTAGAQTPVVQRTGRATIAAGQGSVVINHPEATAHSVIAAAVLGAVADGTLTGIARVVPAAGAFTIYGNANATGAVEISWEMTNLAGADRN